MRTHTTRSQEYQKHHQDHKKPQGATGGKTLRLLLSLLLAVLLVPQVPGYALEGEPAVQQPAQEADPEIAPVPSQEAAAPEAPSQEQAAPATAAGAEDTAAEAPVTEEAGGTDGATEQPAEPPAPQEQGAFATLAEAEDAGAISSVPSDPQGYVTDEVLVVLAGEGTEAGELAAVEESVVEISETDDTVEVELLSSRSDESPLALVELPADVSVADALLQLANDENVAFAQPNYRYTLMDDEFEDSLPEEGELAPADDGGALEPMATTVNDPYANQDYQWWLGAVKAYEAWDKQRVNQAVTIAIIDTGARLTHDDLDDNILQSLAWDAYYKQPLSTSVSQDKVPYNGDVSGHGTHVAGIAAAEANNNLLGAGVSYNAKILPINVFYVDSKTKQLVATTVSVRDAFDYIISKRTEANIRVVNMSFGGSAKEDNDSLLHTKIQTAKNLGILSVCAAGNSGGTNPNYPSDYEEVIAVTNVQQSGNGVVINESSDHNAYKDIAAPGTSILSTHCGSDTETGYMSGTSMATPVVSGIAALLFAKNPNLTPDQVKEALYKTATELGSPGRDNYYGHGLVNADAALAVLDQRYTVIYAPGDHGTWTAASKTTANLLYGVATPAFSGNTATEHHVGYTFAGWSPTWKSTVMGTSATITYTATWSINSYTVTFNPNGGSVSPASVTRTHGSAVGTLPTPTRAGHAFTGWYTAQSGGTKIAESTQVTGRVTYYAQWKEKDLNGTVVTISSAKARSRVLDIPGKSTAAGVKPILWDNAYTPNQRFKLVASADKGYYLIKNVNSGYVLDVSGAKATNGATIVQWPAKPSKESDNQKWKLIPNSNGSYTIVSKLNENRCLDLPGGSIDRETQPILWDKGPNKNNQQFYLDAISEPSLNVTHTISSVVTPIRFVDIEGASRQKDATAILWSENNNNNQKFEFRRNPNTGYYNIVSKHSGMALDVSGASARQGAAVIQWDFHGRYNQQWCIVPSTGGTYVIISAVSGMALDVYGASKDKGAPLIVWPRHGRSNQQWLFDK